MKHIVANGVFSVFGTAAVALALVLVSACSSAPRRTAAGPTVGPLSGAPPSLSDVGHLSVVPTTSACGADGLPACPANAAHDAIEVGGIVTYGDPRPGGAVVSMTASAAIAAVSAHHHTALRAGAHPELVYFPFDFAGRDVGTVNWNAGGEFPFDPIWLVPGADGQDHLVGTDGRVNLSGDLPVVAGASATD